MDSIHIRQRLRPSRYAFVVNDGDLGAALQATSLNAALWGGIYNPIVPLTPSENPDGLIKAFDPDLLVNLTGTELPADLAGRYQHRIVAPANLVRTDDRTNRRELGIGFNILPLIRHVREGGPLLYGAHSRRGPCAPSDGELAGVHGFRLRLVSVAPRDRRESRRHVPARAPRPEGRPS